VAYTHEIVPLTVRSRITVDPHIRFRRFDEEGVIVDQKKSEALVINDVATRLLELANGERTLADCAAVIAEEFDADERAIEADLVRFATELVDAGVAQAS
jgi:hypothetical protein